MLTQNDASSDDEYPQDPPEAVPTNANANAAAATSTMTTNTQDPQQEVPTDANEGCVGPTAKEAGKASACDGCPNQGACSTGAFSSPEAIAAAAAEAEKLKESLSNVSHVILVLSGKGGVGKSTVASQLAHTLASQGYAVGLLDVDLCGPSAPRMVLGDAYAAQTVRKSGSGAWTPVYAHGNLAVMSISFLLQDTNQAVIWRGPRKNALIEQMLTEVDWTGDTNGLDYLIIDTPPGTSDEHISTVQFLQKAGAVAGAIVVTTPEEVSLSDVRKELSFCRKTAVPVLGILENMGTYETSLDQMTFSKDGIDCTKTILETLKEKCPEVLEAVASSPLFSVSPGGAEKMANEYNVPFWGRLPLDPKLLEACEKGQCFVDGHPDTAAATVLRDMCVKLNTILPVDMHE
jgi:Mrp family chromosome partitioning ATPase